MLGAGALAIAKLMKRIDKFGNKGSLMQGKKEKKDEEKKRADDELAFFIKSQKKDNNQNIHKKKGK